MRLLKATVSAALWLLGLACVGLLLAIGVGPRTGSYRTLTVLSGSMRPGIPVGAVVLVTPEPARDLRVGQIVAYNIPVGDHHVVSHRVVQIIKGGNHPVFKTKGDANNAPDPWTTQALDSTMWRVRGTVPVLGNVIHTMRQPLIHTISVLVVPAALAVVLLIAIWGKGPEPQPAT